MQTNAPTKKKPSAKKNENSVLTELAKLIAKHKWTHVHVMKTLTKWGWNLYIFYITGYKTNWTLNVENTGKL